MEFNQYKRRHFITLLGGVAAWPLATRAQQSAMPVIGFLHLGTLAAITREMNVFRQGLSETGFVEGKNVAIEYRAAEGAYDRLAGLASDLVRLQVAVLVTPSNGGAVAAKAATNILPIVFGVNDDPVKLGLVASLNRPGGNATGVNFLNSELAAKRLGLLRELVPTAEFIAVLINPNNPLAKLVTRELERAASDAGQKIGFFKATNNREIDAAFAALVKERAEALLLAPDGIFNNRRVQIVTLATRHGLPAIYQWREYPEIGGLMSYGASRSELFRQLGVYTGKVLHGARPADLPVTQPTKYELVINLNTAKALGINVPVTLLARADEVIE